MEFLSRQYVICFSYKHSYNSFSFIFFIFYVYRFNNEKINCLLIFFCFTKITFIYIFCLLLYNCLSQHGRTPVGARTILYSCTVTRIDQFVERDSVIVVKKVIKHQSINKMVIWSFFFGWPLRFFVWRWTEYGTVTIQIACQRESKKCSAVH